MLNCIVICRCMDKKPYGNIMENFTANKLFKKAVLSNFRGGGVMNHDTASFSSASVILQAATTRESAKLKNPLGFTSESEIVDKPTATIVGYNDLGKSFAPLSDN